MTCGFSPADLLGNGQTTDEGILVLWLLVYCALPKTSCDNCNTMFRFTELDVYPNYANDDYGQMHITYIGVGNEKYRHWISYAVHQPAEVHQVETYHVITGSTIQKCTVNFKVYSSCCIHNKEPRKSHSPFKCESSYVVYNREYDAREYLLVYEHRKHSIELATSFIWFKVKVASFTRWYFSQHEQRDDTVVCPQFGKMPSSTPPELGHRLSATSETHTMRLSDLKQFALVEEFQGVQLNTNAFATDVHRYKVLHFIYNPMSNVFRVKEVPWRSWHSRYRANIRNWTQLLHVERHSKALLMIIHPNNASVTALLEELLKEWIVYRNMHKKFEWPSSWQSPAIRLVGLKVTRKSVFLEGDNKTIYVEPEYIHPHLKSICYKRLTESDEYTPTDRLIITPNKPYFELRIMTIDDSGMYRCETPKDANIQYQFFTDYYIIVLPREKDVWNYLALKPPEPGDAITDNYPYIDALNRSYFINDKPIFGSCIYLLSKGLDNYNGQKMHYLIFDGYQPEQVRKFTRDLGGRFLLVHVYEIAPRYSTEAVESEFSCLYQYEQNFSKVLHHPTIPVSKTNFVKTRRIVATKHKKPLIITTSIQTNSPELTRKLRTFTWSTADVYDPLKASVPESNVLEGLLYGSFVVLISEYDGWVSVYTGDEMYQEPCSLVSYGVQLHPDSPLLSTVEMKNSHGLIAKQYRFECTLTAEKQSLLLSAYNPVAGKVDKTAAEYVTHRLANSFLHRVPMAEFIDERNSVPDVLLSLRLARLFVRWQGTVNSGDFIQMQWRTDVRDASQVVCFYRMNETIPWREIGPHFQFRLDTSKGVFRLTKRKALQEDSGLYHCRFCIDCIAPTESETRRLVVSPNSSELAIDIDHGNSHHNGSGSLDDPVKTDAPVMQVKCSVKLYRGIQQRSFELNHSYETAVPDSDTHMKLETLSNYQLVRSADEYHHLLNMFDVEKPKSHDYWKYVRISCRLVLVDVVHDPRDILDNVSTITSTRSVYLKYELFRGPVMIPEFIQTSSETLTSALRSNESTHMSTVLSSKAIDELENVFTVEYTMFMGLPEGWTKVWKVTCAWDTTSASDCILMKSSIITDPSVVAGLESNPTYQVNRGLNFMKHHYVCLLNIHSSLLVIGSFAQSESNHSKDEIESETKQATVSAVQCKSHVTERVIVKETKRPVTSGFIITTRAVLLNIMWAASTNIGQSALMLGIMPPKPFALQCFHKTDTNPIYRRLTASPESRVSFELVAFRKTFEQLNYSDSGTYKCNTTEPCPFCSPDVGIPPRQMSVFPDESILSVQLNLQPLQPDSAPSAHFAQYTDDGVPYLKAGQKASVQCVYEVSPVERFHAELHMLYEVYDIERSKSVGLPAMLEANFTKMKNGRSFFLAGYAIVAPMAHQVLSRAECRLTYRPGATPHDVAAPVGVVYVSKGVNIHVIIDAAANLFPEYIISDTMEIFNNWYSISNQEPNAIHFHRSASDQLLEEGIFTFHSMQALGVPAGTTLAFVIHQHSKRLYHEECRLVSTEQADDADIPVDLKVHQAYLDSGGKHFFNVTFQCLLQPRHLGLVFLVYNNKYKTVDHYQSKALLIRSILDKVDRWIREPMSPETSPENQVSGVRASYAVVKLKIGWKNVVFIGQPWKILIRDFFSLKVNFTVFHQQSPNREKQPWAHLVAENFGDSVGSKEARFNDSGIYSCTVTSGCDECEFKHCFGPRRLLVLPSTQLLHMYLQERRLTSTESIVDNMSDRRIGTGQKAYAYCVYIRPRGFSHNEQLQFRAELEATASEAQRILRHKEYPTRYVEEASGTVVTTTFELEGPRISGAQSVLRMSCSLNFDPINLDPAGMVTPRQLQFVRVNRTLEVEAWLKPIVFTDYLGASNDMLKKWLRRSLNEPLAAYHFNQQPEVKYIIPEDKVWFSVTAFHGIPTGWIYASQFTFQDGNIYEEPCVITRQRNLTREALPQAIFSHPELDTTAFRSMAWTEFTCAMRREHFAIAIIAYTTASEQKRNTVQSQAVQLFTQWLRLVVQNPTDHRVIPVGIPPRSLVTYLTARMRVGWNASVLVGSKISMIGHLTTMQDKLYCYYQSTAAAAPTPISNMQIMYRDQPTSFELVKPNAQLSDAGIYSCEFVRSECAQCKPQPTISNRRLVVLPDYSVVSMFLTHQKLGIQDRWVANFTTCDKGGQPIIYTDTLSYIHCQHWNLPNDWLLLEVEFSSILLRWDEKTEPFPLKRIPSQNRSDHAVLDSAEVDTHNLEEDDSTLIVECRWKYHYPKPLFNDLSGLKSPFLLSLNKTIRVMLLITPYIHHLLVSTDDLAIQAKMRRLDFETSTAVEFHADDYCLRMNESITIIHITVTLGVPPGWFEAWSYYRNAEQLVKEDCILVSAVNLTDSVVHQASFIPRHRFNRANTALNTSYVCNLRYEHVAMVWVAQHTQSVEVNITATRKTFEQSIHSSITHWLNNPLSRYKSKIDRYDSSYATYRVFKLAINWRHTVVPGEQIKILGFYNGRTGTSVRCFHSLGEKFELLTRSKGFHLVFRKELFGFYLIAPYAQFYHTGLYVCNVTEDNCRKCVPQIAFVPRWLTVKPDVSQFRLWMSHRLRDQAERYFFQCTDDNQPYLLDNEIAYVYCLFHWPVKTQLNIPSFTLTTVNNATNLTSSLYVNEVKRTVEQQEAQFVVTHVFSLDTRQARGPDQQIAVICEIRVPEVNFTWALVKHIHVWVRVKPIIFRAHILTSNPIVTRALRTQLGLEAISARSFHRSWVGEHVLEGTLWIHYIAGLGSPQGWSGVDLLFKDGSRIRRKRCDAVRQPHIPDGPALRSLQSTDHFEQTGGADLVKYKVNCPLTSDVIGIMLLVMNSFDHQLSLTEKLAIFYRSVYWAVQQWLKDSNSTDATYAIRQPQGTLLQYSLIHVRVGWRASVVHGDPVVMFGVLLWNQADNIRCTYRGPADAPKKEINIRRDGVHVNIDWKSGSFELIKPTAKLSDSGTYECASKRCPSCKIVPILIPHQLIVVPQQLHVMVHYSKLSSLHLGNYSGRIYEQYTDSGQPFIYEGQSIMVICEHHAEQSTASWMQLLFEYVRLHASNLTTTVLPHEDTGVQTEYKDTYVNVYTAHRIVGPVKMKHGDSLQTICRLELNKRHITSDDINQRSRTTAFLSSRQLQSRIWKSPKLISNSINTSVPRITRTLRSDSQNRPTALEFVHRFYRESLTEGELYVAYLSSRSVPEGWSSVFSIYNHSSGFVARSCVRRVAQQDATYHVYADKLNYSQYVCVLIRGHVGVLIYTAHYPEEMKNRTHFETEFLPYSARLIERWFHNFHEQLRLPSDAPGDYRLVPIRVHWPNIFHIGDAVQMYGLLDTKGLLAPLCFYGYLRPHRPLLPLQEFQFILNRPFSYFILSKRRIQMTDAGVYKCTVFQCSNCPDVLGFEDRPLHILPDVSMLSLKVKRFSPTGTQQSACQDGPISSLAPGEKLLISCSHTAPKGALPDRYHIISYGLVSDSSADGNLGNLVTSESFAEPDLVTLTSVGTLRLPNFPEPSKKWHIQCQLPQTVLARVSIDSRSGSPLNKQQTKSEQLFDILNKRDPVIIKHKVETLEGRKVHSLNDYVTLESIPRAGIPGSDRNHSIEEGAYIVTYVADIGLPSGWTFLRLYYVHQGAVIHSDRCINLRVRNVSSNPSYRLHKSICIVQPEHIALLMVAVHLPEMLQPWWTVQQMIETMLLTNLTKWLGYKSRMPVVRDDVICFRFDYRLLRLNVSWKAILNAGDPIRMQGRLGAFNPKSLTCHHQPKYKEKPTKLTSVFNISFVQRTRQFFIMKPNADPADTGYYHCFDPNVSSHAPLYIGMQKRKLLVLPSTSRAHCILFLDEDRTKFADRLQRLEEGMVYLLSGQTAFIQCAFEESLESLYDISFGLAYEIHDTRTNQLHQLPSILFRSERNQIDGIRYIVHLHRIMAPSANYSTGSLRIHCFGKLSDTAIPRSINQFNDSVQVGCDQWLTIREPANGNLNIDSLVDYFEHQPVPLGSEFTCSGGQGMPPIRHSWVRIKPPLYSDKSTDEDLAMLLPADGGGWGGPDEPFVDMPRDGLEVIGPLLRVPYNESYRGMSYLYKCVGTNQIAGVSFSISRTIHLSILICPTDQISMDMSMYHSPRLMAACRIVNNPHPSIQHFGYFYLTLVRQLILGLPYGVHSTRFSLLSRKRTGMGGLKKSSFHWTPFSPLVPRNELLKNIYSKQVMPSSGQAACMLRLDPLSDVVSGLNHLYQSGFDKNPVFLFPVDTFMTVDLDVKLVAELIRLNKSGIKVILAFTHPIHSEYNEYNEKLIRLLSPFKYLNILPYFEGTSDCYSCQLEFKDNRARIARLGLFNAVCQAAGSVAPPPIDSPYLMYSLPKRLWSPGLTILITCMMSRTIPNAYAEGIEMSICLTDNKHIEALAQPPTPNVQRLRKSCYRTLDARQFSASSEERLHMGKGSVTGKVVVQNTTYGLTVLCYQRYGEEQAKLFDSINFTYLHVVRSVDQIGKPNLSLVQWPSTETAAAKFRCIFEGFAANLEALLLYQKTSHLNSKNTRYTIIHRKVVSANPVGHSTTCALHWFELSTTIEEGFFYCLLRPISNSTISQRFLAQLPAVSSFTRYSDPLPKPRTKFYCPVKPHLSLLEEQRLTSLKTGSSLNAKCTAVGNSIEHSVHLAYLTTSFSIFLCFHTGVHYRNESTCFLTLPSDRDCHNRSRTDSKQLSDYSFECVHRTESSDHLMRHVILFRIKKLQARDFNARLFCYIAGQHVPDSQNIQQSLTSRVHAVRFNLSPQVVHFAFVPNTESWHCTIVSYPFVGQGDLRPIRVMPHWLRKQLADYVSTVSRVQPRILHEDYVSGTRFEPVEYRIDISFHPVIPVVGGLMSGEAEFQCSVNGVSQNLVTVIGQGISANESDSAVHMLHEHGRHMRLNCSFDTTASNPITQINLHRLVDTTWLQFDLVLLTVKVSNKSAQLYQANSPSSTFYLFGPWVMGGAPEIRVLTDDAEGRSAVDITWIRGTP
ncbi:unnamed protein product [Dicrocoelium dendriticum]|nr:unnamed protein product [Dicrocoelium dendriticum]